MKKIGFLSFGHWSPARGSRVRTAEESLKQAVGLAVASEKIGIDGAYFRVHHWANQQMAPIPLLATIAAKTTRLEVGTGVIDMRYESPLYLAEESAQLDILSDQRLQLGISRGSPETADRGYRYFGHVPEGSDADMARDHTAQFLRAIEGEGIAAPNPQMVGGTGRLRLTPYSPGLRQRIWWGAGTRDTAIWAASKGMQLMSSTLLLEDRGIPFDQLQLEQIEAFLQTWDEAGWDWDPQTSVSRSIVPLIDEESIMYFGDGGHGETVGFLDGHNSRFGPSFVGTPEQLAEDLSHDVALAKADMVLVTVPNQLGVEYNARQLAAIYKIGTELGWNDGTAAQVAQGLDG